MIQNTHSGMGHAIRFSLCAMGCLRELLNMNSFSSTSDSSLSPVSDWPNFFKQNFQFRFGYNPTHAELYPVVKWCKVHIQEWNTLLTPSSLCPVGCIHHTWSLRAFAYTQTSPCLIAGAAEITVKMFRRIICIYFWRYLFTRIIVTLSVMYG